MPELIETRWLSEIEPDPEVLGDQAHERARRSRGIVVEDDGDVADRLREPLNVVPDEPDLEPLVQGNDALEDLPAGGGEEGRCHFNVERDPSVLVNPSCGEPR